MLFVQYYKMHAVTKIYIYIKPFYSGICREYHSECHNGQKTKLSTNRLCNSQQGLHGAGETVFICCAYPVVLYGFCIHGQLHLTFTTHPQRFPFDESMEFTPHDFEGNSVWLCHYDITVRSLSKKCN